MRLKEKMKKQNGVTEIRLTKLLESEWAETGAINFILVGLAWKLTRLNFSAVYQCLESQKSQDTPLKHLGGACRRPDHWASGRSPAWATPLQAKNIALILLKNVFFTIKTLQDCNALKTLK